MSSHHESVKRLKRVIRRDKRFKRLKELFETAPQYNIAVSDFEREIEVTFRSRKMRDLRNKRADGTFVQEIIDTLMEDQAFRGRLTEIATACVRCNKSLSGAMEKMHDYLLIEYHAQLVSVYSTKAERERFVSNTMREFDGYIKKVSVLHEQVNLMMVDIDKAGFALKNTIEAIQLLSKSEIRV